MNIVENEGKVSIDASLIEGVFEFFGKSMQGMGFVIIFAFGAITSMRGVLGFTMALFLLLLGWELMSLLFGATDVFYCVIDKDAKTIKITKRNPATFWTPMTESYKLQDLKLVAFGKIDNADKKLTLNFKDNEQVVFSGGASTKIAETLSATLRIPLQIEFGDERITHVPWAPEANPGLIPTPCLSCGAPLPHIKMNSGNVKCTHCNMVMVIQWGDGKFSYRKQAE